MEFTIFQSLLSSSIFICSLHSHSNMVSELAGEGAVPPQLPTPASHAELRCRRRDERIRRGSSLRRGVNLVKTVMLFTPSTVFVPLSLDGNSRSRSVEISSRVLVNPLVAVFNRTSWSRSVRNSSRVLDSLLVAFRSWRRSMENMSAELVNSSLVIIDCSSWSRSSENLSDSRSRSVEILSRVLVACNNNLSFSESLTVRPSYDALTVPSPLPSAPKAPEKDSELYPQWKRCNALITLWILSRRKSRTDQEVGGDLGENQPDRSLVKLVRGSQQVPIIKINAREWRCLVSMDGVCVWFSRWTSEWYVKEDSPLALNIVVEKVLSYCGTLMSVDGWTSDENTQDCAPAALAITRRLREDGSLIGVLNREQQKTDEGLLRNGQEFDISVEHYLNNLQEISQNDQPIGSETISFNSFIADQEAVGDTVAMVTHEKAKENETHEAKCWNSIFLFGTSNYCWLFFSRFYNWT